MDYRRFLRLLLVLPVVFAFDGGSSTADAQTYVCPPGYYFLAGDGCYPFGGYAYPAVPAPPGYYYPAYPYAVPAPPTYYQPYPYGGGFTFEFGGRDRDHDRSHDHGHR
jgi:hypothetical protein